MEIRSFILVLATMFSNLSTSELSPSQIRRTGQQPGSLVLHDYIVHLQIPTRTRRGDLILELAKRIEDSQIRKDRPYRFPMTWQQDKGMYPSEVKLNVVGEPQLAFLRDQMSVFDNNMFATTWVTICLLEVHKYTKGPTPIESQLNLALEAIGQYHDKNRAFNNSVMNFWPQALNGSSGVWESTPTNMLKAFGVFDVVPVKLLEEVLKLLGLKDVEHFLERILDMRSIFERAFHIPPDFDDTFVNLGLGALLKDLGQDVPQALSLWTSHNTNATSSVLDALKKYAYRPFSQDQNVNTIDPRTFYYMRQFLADAQGRKEDIALVPTWAQNLDEARRDYYQGVAMPFQINNVDVTVSANAIYGLTSSVLSGVFPETVMDDPEIKQVYVNTSSMVAWQIIHQLYHRPDLELAYYPSMLEFYWFAARTLALLETAMVRTKPLPQAMVEVYQILKPALEKNMTWDVVSRARPMTEDMVFFDDFLGDGDVDRHNRTVVRGEDRLFTTSMAINALLSTWTVFDDHDRTLSWKDNTPPDVRTTVERSLKFLDAFILKDTYKPWNAFFSGSSKGSSSMPFGYPANRIEYLNGTVIHDDQHFPQGGPFLFGVRGLIPESQYQVLIHQKHFGTYTPTTFTSYNQPGSYFPFWTSSAYTYSTAMLALARFENIVG